ncbi:MAG: energy-coupling factor ABC transporter ATP-binding protein [Oscillospiraceae bacterium]|jgi:putative ABC transport system ATP-binding protein|nr:energy-coupling factor ABC transporter ATP-binding protein [Oscillospiraceae bacterium]
MDTLIKTRGLTFLDKIAYPDMEIISGRAAFICGESGCGKSTLLKLFSGVITPSGGTVEYLGKDTGKYDPITLRKEILLCSQSVFLFDDTVGGNFRQFYGYREQKAPDTDRMREFLALCRLEFGLDAPCVTMSGGERHRVFIAICLSFLPKVIMLDEPTAALDGQTADGLLSGVIGFCAGNGITPVIVCHDRALSEKYADDMIVLERGAR